MRIFTILLVVFLLDGCSWGYRTKYVGKQPSTLEQRVTFIGEDQNRTNGYTRTLVTLKPFPLTKRNRYAPFVISTYPIPTQVYVSCSNFRTTNSGYYEYRKPYIQKYHFEPGKFYKFHCSKHDSSLSGEYTVSMEVFDTKPKLKTKF